MYYCCEWCEARILSELKSKLLAMRRAMVYDYGIAGGVVLRDKCEEAIAFAAVLSEAVNHGSVQALPCLLAQRELRVGCHDVADFRGFQNDFWRHAVLKYRAKNLGMKEVP